MREGKGEGERVGTRDYEKATVARRDDDRDTSETSKILSKKEAVKGGAFENRNNESRDRMTYDNNPPSPSPTTSAAINAGEGGIGRDW
jgi:hypothetical protein